MKYIILTSLIAVLLGLSLPGLSQIYKGHWLAGGNAEFNSYKYYSNKISIFTVSSNGGYFFADRWAGGLRLIYEAENSRRNNIRALNTFMQPLAFIRYYLIAPGQKINFFLDGGYGYSWGKYKSNDPYSNTETWHSEVIAIKGGPALFLNSHTSLEFTVGYNYSLPHGLSDTLAANSFRMGLGFQIHLGKQKE